ncbi:MAG: hypothetical protein JNK87_35770 [Bryobacterales bacterium]|nr:hypothetical protein [Bryobacterales bacterium]
MKFHSLIYALTLALTTGLAGLQGAMILPTGNVECDLCNPSLIGVTQLPTVNNIAGVRIFTLSPITIIPEDLEDGDFEALLSISTLGNITDVPPVATLQIPVSYSMTLSTTGSAQIVDWLLFIGVGLENDDEDGILGFIEFAGSGAGTFAGTGTMTFVGTDGVTSGFGGVLVGLDVLLTGSGNVILDSPHSFNVGAVPTSGVPEPATVGAGITAMFLLLAARKIRRA